MSRRTPPHQRLTASLLLSLAAIALVLNVGMASASGHDDEPTTTTTEQATTTTEQATTTTEEPTTTTEPASTTSTTERHHRRHRPPTTTTPPPRPTTTPPPPVTQGAPARVEVKPPATAAPTTAAPTTAAPTTTAPLPPLPTTSTTAAGEQQPHTALAAASIDRGGPRHGSGAGWVWILAVVLGLGVFGAVIGLDRRSSNR